MQYLTVAEVADLNECTVQNIRKLALTGKLNAEVTYNEQNRPKYLIPITELDARLQLKYYKQRGLPSPAQALPEESPQKAKKYDEFSADERAQIDFWTETVWRWQEFCNASEMPKAASTQSFIEIFSRENPEINISKNTLYRKQIAVKNGDLSALVDNRGSAKRGSSTISDEIWDCFLWYYLNENRPPLSQCYEYTLLQMQQSNPQLAENFPSESAFRRKLKSVPAALEALGRYGEKYYRDRFAPYISRSYENMESNDYWVADNHTFDVRSKDSGGRLHRLHLTAFLDARSGIMTCWYLTENPSSQATLIALRKGILKYGIPKEIYVDNGREFLTFDLGGKGHRTKKSDKEKFSPPPIFERLGINMTNAIVRNGRAKVIERWFLTLKNDVSKLFESFTGGNVTERPEKLKAVEKQGNIICDEDFIKNIDTLIEGYLNFETYNGSVAADKGKRKIDVYYERLKTKRIAPKEELELMLMRSTRSQKVGRKGVHLNILGERLDYWTDEFLLNFAGKEVYLRYDPDNLDEIRVYDLEDRFICALPRDNLTNAAYGVSKEKISDMQKRIRQAEKTTKNALKGVRAKGAEYSAPLELRLMQAQKNLSEEISGGNACIVELARSIEEPAALPRAVGDDSVRDDGIVDKQRMLKNLEDKHKQGGNYGY